jgi:hypothetical protein
MSAEGAWNIIGIVLSVDVTLGPLLTFVVFQAGKKGLKFDLTFIAAVQISALIYGMYTLWQPRPVYIAALGHRFDVVAANVVEPKGAANISFLGPRWIGVRDPKNAEESNRVLFGSLGGATPGALLDFHQPYTASAKETLSRSNPIDRLLPLNAGREAEIQQWLSNRGRTNQNTRYQGLKARSKDMAVMLDATTGDIVGIAPFTPW